MKWIVLSALVISGLYIVMCCLLYAMQDRLLYFPTPEGHPVVGTALVVRSGDVALKIWEVHGDTRDAVLYFGGNAEDVSAKISEFDAIFTRPGDLPPCTIAAMEVTRERLPRNC